MYVERSQGYGKKKKDVKRCNGFVLLRRRVSSFASFGSVYTKYLIKHREETRMKIMNTNRRGEREKEGERGASVEDKLPR